MGKASSSKKVARAARAGGSSGPKQRKLAFPLAIVAIMVLGVALVAFARSDYTAAEATAPVVNVDHWHAAYGVYVCGAFQPSLADVSESDTTGVHTHGDGIIHIHPYVASAAGKNATFSKWSVMSGVEFGSDSITLPDGTKLENGYDCGGNTDTEVGVWAWDIDKPDAEPTVYTKDFGSIRLSDRTAYTIAVVPTGTTPPKPESLGDIDRLDPNTDNVIPDDPTAGSTPDMSILPTDPNAPIDPNATTDSSLPADPNASIDPNATTDSSLPADPNAIVDPNAAPTSVPQ